MKNSFYGAAASFIFVALLTAQTAFAQNNHQIVPLNFGDLEPVENIDPIYQVGSQHAVIIEPESGASDQPRKAIVKEVLNTSEMAGNNQYRAKMNCYVFTEGSNRVILQPCEQRFTVDGDGNTDVPFYNGQGSVEILTCDPESEEGKKLCAMYTQAFGSNPPSMEKSPSGQTYRP